MLQSIRPDSGSVYEEKRSVDAKDSSKLELDGGDGSAAAAGEVAVACRCLVA